MKILRALGGQGTVGGGPVVQLPPAVMEVLGGAQLHRPTTAQRVADILRERILQGELGSGTQFAELQLSTALGVSRNTLREAFQILIGEHLLVHEPHRGVFVRRLDVRDVRDIYAFRRVVECAALARPEGSRGLAEMRAAVAEGYDAAAREAWHEVGTADVRFHMGVTAVAGSERLDRAIRGLFAELRLAFSLVPDPPELHRPFLDLNAEILDLAEQGRAEQASLLLRRYLDDAEGRIVAAVQDPIP